MITREALIRSKEHWLVNIQIDLYAQVEKYLRENNMSKTEFASKLGVSKGYISQLLNGDFDHKISKLVELSLAIGMAPVLKFQSLDKYVALDALKISAAAVSKPAKGIASKKLPVRKANRRKVSVAQ